MLSITTITLSPKERQPLPSAGMNGPVKSRRYDVYYRFVPLPSAGMYDAAKDGEEIESPIPHRVFAYTAEDAITQAGLAFKYGSPDEHLSGPSNPRIKKRLYDDLGRDFKVIRVTPGDRV
jgi:hypothetical protein